MPTFSTREPVVVQACILQSLVAQPKVEALLAMVSAYQWPVLQCSSHCAIVLAVLFTKKKNYIQISSVGLFSVFGVGSAVVAGSFVVRFLGKSCVRSAFLYCLFFFSVELSHI